MKLSKAQIHSFQSMIFSWWKENRRDLPWRHTHDPYKIVVSELMLQQTQVLRVIPKYAEFTEAYPTVFDLAKASTADVLRMWKGMGYNRRALYLKKMAEIIVQKYSGVFPRQEKELLALPGLGTYTARAILVFAYEKDVAMIDTNIRQIITHFFCEDKPQKESIIQDIANQLVPAGKSWDWHQALMDYGAREMRRRSIAKKSAPSGALPFSESNRFFRGRIIDRLREGSMPEHHLYTEFENKYKRQREFIQHIVERLEYDGLLVREKGNVSLPS